MIKNIRYHDYNDSLWFESDSLGDCDIDKDGTFSFQLKSGTGFYKTEITIYSSVEELREIIKLYDNRKNIKER